MKDATVVFVKELVGRFPALQGVLSEHLEDQCGKVLPHPFMGNASRWLIERFISEGKGDVTVRSVLDFVEQAFRNGDKQLRELLSVSFLENLPQPGQRGHEILSILGPSLQLELQNLG